MLVLPGFEFTATFGFHILAIFDPSTSIRLMEHLLLSLGVPEDRFGSGEVGATSDVLKAYELLDDHGALVIGAHVNSTHGVAMRNIRFGGQTKIAYTQDSHLHALEVTDLASTSARATARFFNGTKAEYSRRMHAIQGSDAHRLKQDPARPTNLGIGDRVTEFYLPQRSFTALRACLLASDWEQVRAARMGGPQASAVHSAREIGPSQEFAFYERIQGGPKTSVSAVVRDVVAFANGDGGTVFIGVGPSTRKTVPGVPDPEKLQVEVGSAIRDQVEPALSPDIETISYEGKSVLVARIQPGPDRPYALATGDILVRRGAETSPARRDEIVRLVRGESVATTPDTPQDDRQPVQQSPRPRQVRPLHVARTIEPGIRTAPRNGVEIVEREVQDGAVHYAMRDLRTDQVTRNVTMATARSLWAQAIREYEKGVPTEDRISWNGDVGFWKSVRISNGERRFHLAAREPDGRLRLFFGVSDEVLDDRWKAVIPARPAPSERSEASLPG